VGIGKARHQRKVSSMMPNFFSHLSYRSMIVWE
jgi:hypothetical protein